MVLARAQVQAMTTGVMHGTICTSMMFGWIYRVVCLGYQQIEMLLRRTSCCA